MAVFPVSGENFTPTLASELEILAREHAHVSASLLENRRKGATRFNVYILIVGTALAALGLRGGLIPREPSGDADWSVVAAFAFLIVFGWIMLQTLIRRSITTDKHLEALQSLRERCFHYHPDLKDVLPSAQLPEARDPMPSFEYAKQRYYKTGHSALETPQSYLAYLSGQLFPREILPHYGDLVENVCALNAFVISTGLIWMMAPPAPSLLSVIFIGLAFAVSYLWVWQGQMMYVWYKHTFDWLLLRDDVRASSGGAPEGTVTEAALQERDDEHEDLTAENLRRYMHKLRRAMIKMSMLQAAAVALAMGLVGIL